MHKEALFIDTKTPQNLVGQSKPLHFSIVESWPLVKFQKLFISLVKASTEDHPTDLILGHGDSMIGPSWLLARIDPDAYIYWFLPVDLGPALFAFLYLIYPIWYFYQ